MKKYLTILFAFCMYLSVAQEIHVENGIAYIGDMPYVKITKKNKKNYFIYDLTKNEKIIRVNIGKKHNKHANTYYHNTKLYFLKLDKNAEFSEIKVKTPKDIAQLLYDKQLILYDGLLNEELAIEYHETIPIGKRCPEIFEKDFSGILYHKFRPVIKDNAVVINEVKYECVQTALYTKKVLYDKFGMWTKEIYRKPKGRLPELVWQDVQLFEDDTKKFTVVARGVESMKTIYASIMVFDENNYDMLHKNSPYRDKIVKRIGDLIKNDINNKEFYKAFWSKYDPERWKKIVAENKRVDTARQYPYTPSSNQKN